MKPNSRVRCCTKFCDLNKACPKDNFPFPHIDAIVDSTTRYDILSFMDIFACYNQIKINPIDQEKTSFTTPWGNIFLYSYALRSLKCSSYL